MRLPLDDAALEDEERGDVSKTWISRPNLSFTTASLAWFNKIYGKGMIIEINSSLKSRNSQPEPVKVGSSTNK